MDLELRTIEPGEVEEFVESLSVPFLEAGDEAKAARYIPHVESERAWAVVDHGRIVATACIFSRDVTLPAPPGEDCAVTPFAAVSGVGVHPTHRRKGLLRRLMGEMLRDARERGEPFAGLFASESSIYGRFGFGQASALAETVIDTARSAFARPVPAADLRMLDKCEAAKLLPDLHDRLRRKRPGEVSRNDASWAGILADPPPHREGGSALYFAACDDSYAIYRAHDISRGALFAARLEVRDLYGATSDAEASVWRFLADVDMVTELSARRPLDDHLPWRLEEPRQLRTTAVRDALWLRIVDTGAALEARGYGTEGRLVISVEGGDALVAGRWTLEVEGDAVSCRSAAARDKTDVSLGVAELGAVYLGGVSVSTLASAGRAVEDRSGGLRRADQMFAVGRAPFSGTGF